MTPNHDPEGTGSSSNMQSMGVSSTVNNSTIGNTNRTIDIINDNSPESDVQLSSPKLLASSVDNNVNINGRFIPSSSTISLLSLGADEGSASYQDDQHDMGSAESSGFQLNSKRSQLSLSVKSLRNTGAINQQRHKYYNSATSALTSPTTPSSSAPSKTLFNNTSIPNSSVDPTPSNISRLSAQLKKTSLNSPVNNPINTRTTSPRISDKFGSLDDSQFHAPNSLQKKNSFMNGIISIDETPDSPNLEPTSFSNSPSKIFLFHRRQSNNENLPKNISHLSLSAMGNDKANQPPPLVNRRPSYKNLSFQDSILFTPGSASNLRNMNGDYGTKAKNISINSIPNRGNESPVLRPVQTPGSDICMTPLMLSSYKGSNNLDSNSTINYVDNSLIRHQEEESAIINDEDEDDEGFV
ncbi:hypothetical protein DASC09_039620 [Saccharomycopsis crataegensis]|uniref:Uncharacterized protein n=1 Tax=Saccharomycopsis crataegensis TaxID=43959 RepID=A0AAV5QQ57_9ASCO|nr:hypothetical protein DASC09_039620 [Saccharomycopsis crataegensis]